MTANHAQVVSTGGIGNWTPSPYFSNPNGYTCSCGTWVNYGTYHHCVWRTGASWPEPVYVFPQYRSDPLIKRFRGSTKDMKSLPRRAYRPDGGYSQQGDAYFVEDPGVLVVRLEHGWHTFDGD